MIETQSDELIPLSHPGVTLFEDIMEPLGLTAYGLAKALDVPTSRIDDIVAGRRGITADTALRLAAYLDTSPEFWLGLQTDYDLRLVKLKTKINVKPRVAA
jgi:addiction module HigA family antidote